jgi:hypothetical protein
MRRSIDAVSACCRPLARARAGASAPTRAVTLGALLTVALAAIVAGPLAPAARAQEKLHFTYLWHMEQPIYWPDRQATGADRYETAWASILRKDAGAPHPENNLREIFSVADRVAGYQSRMADSIWGFSLGRPEAGAQISYSGGLIENIRSLGNANQLGYSPTWFQSLRTARGWTTFSGSQVPRADIVIFPYHHALMPLIDTSTMRKQVQLYKAAYADAWGTSVPASKGFFPSEMAFSERMIPVLASEGIEWSIVSAEKLSRACADFPYVQGTGGNNMDPPNRADQLNPAQGTSNYFRAQIDRGCSPAEAYPFALTPQRARSVDPNTGAVSSIIVVPASQSLGWKDGYAPLGIGDFNTLQTRNDPARPMLVVLAHDGDNAWGGGFSYYREATPNLVNQAAGAGYVPTVIQRYLADHPVPANDIVKVEDGAWVNADGDFGAPQFLNWNWPPVTAQGRVDIENGWAEDIRNWAVITAMQNRVDTAEQIWLAQGNSVNIRNILAPENPSTNSVERAWHYFMGGLNSGYMYYGTAVDMEVKPTIACNNAARLIDPLLAAAPASGPTSDRTGPTVWIPQRHPWNPGSNNFGPQYQYKSWKSNGDFYVWTFVSDVSGMTSVRLKYRLDADGVNTLASTDNETYLGGPGVGAWQTLDMTRRAFPAGNFFNDPTINFYVMPQHIADQYFVRVNGVRSQLVDYYVEATDAKGNVTRSPIQHVYVGDGVNGLTPTPDSGYGSGSTGGGSTSPAVALLPTAPVAGQPVTITYNPAGRALASAAQVRIHWGVNTWQNVPSPDPLMTPNPDGTWSITLTPATSACTLNFVFNNGAGTWDNNAGANWNTPLSGCVTPPPPPAPWSVNATTPDARAKVVATNGSRQLLAGLQGNVLYVAGPNAQSSSGGQDVFVFVARQPGALRAAQWAKAGQVAAWDAFLAAESSNTYSGWFNATGAGVSGTPYQNARGASGTGWLVGTIDLATLFGSAANIPRDIFLAHTSYATTDAGALATTLQIPASLNANANLDTVEFVRVPLCSISIDAGVTCACNPADLGDNASNPGPDGCVDNGDFSLFISQFFSTTIQNACTGAPVPCAASDIGDNASNPTPDGLLDNGDFSLFISSFFGAACAASCAP